MEKPVRYPPLMRNLMMKKRDKDTEDLLEAITKSNVDSKNFTTNTITELL